MAKATMYENNNYGGQSVVVTEDIPDFRKIGFNDKLSSVVVESGTFTLYADINYEGVNVTISATGGPSNDGAYPIANYLGGRNDYYSSIRINSENPLSSDNS
jgi:hypothetical protein